MLRIHRFTHSTSLFVAYPVAYQGYIIYDATEGPCASTMYSILNEPGAHNGFYRPGEDPDHAGAVPDAQTPYPWMH